MSGGAGPKRLWVWPLLACVLVGCSGAARSEDLGEGEAWWTFFGEGSGQVPAGASQPWAAEPGEQRVVVSILTTEVPPAVPAAENEWASRVLDHNGVYLVRADRTDEDSWLDVTWALRESSVSGEVALEFGSDVLGWTAAEIIDRTPDPGFPAAVLVFDELSLQAPDHILLLVQLGGPPRGRVRRGW